MKVESESEVAQSWRTLSDPMDCSLPGSSIHGIFQATVLEWGAIALSQLWVIQDRQNLDMWYELISLNIHYVSRSKMFALLILREMQTVRATESSTKLILILKITLWIVLSLVRVILLTGMPHKSFASNAKRLLSRKYFKSFENISLTESQPWSPQFTRKFIVYTCFSIRMQYMALNQNQDSHTPTVLCWSKKQRARTITQRRKKISIRERND